MGHSDWVNKRVDETGGMRLVGRDTMGETGTHHGPALTTHFAPSGCYSWKLVRPECGFLNGTDFGLPPLTRFQSPHLTENTCHEKSDFYIIIMIIVYVL